MLIYDKLSLDDLDNMSELYELYLNSGPSISGWLREGLTESGYVGLKCLDGERMVGVISARPGVEFTCGHEDISSLIKQRWAGYQLYTGDMMAVLPAYRNQGIARELARGFKDELIRNGCERLVLEEWHRSLTDDIPASGVHKYFGKYELVGKYNDFYRDIGKYGLACPECGGSSCRCGAYICVITLA